MNNTGTILHWWEVGFVDHKGRACSLLVLAKGRRSAVTKIQKEVSHSKPGCRRFIARRES